MTVVVIVKGDTPMAQTTAQDRKTNGHSTEARTARVKDSAQATLDAVTSKGGEALDRVHAAGEAAVREGTDLVTGAQSELNSVVRRNPTLAVAGALGLGVLLGMALRARS